MNNCLQSNISPGIQSDHSVVSLKFKDDQPARGPSFWKLNCCFLHDDAECIKIVKEKIEDFKLIHSDSQCNPNVLWDALKCTITGTCIEYSSRKEKERKAQKDKLFKEIDEIKIKIDNDTNDNALIGQLDQIMNVQLNKILDNETQVLIIRSRIRWAEEGEKSTKYFCNLEKRIGEKKSIFRIKKDNDDIISDREKVLEEIQTFYQNVYKNQNINNEAEITEHFLDSIETPHLDENDKKLMEQSISKKELYDTLASMKHNKSPGYDGLPSEFYVVFWNDISDLLLNSYNFSLQNGLMSFSQRNGIITLIPKKDKDVLFLKNYRPISLLTVDYKMLAKTLANRLKNVCCNLSTPTSLGF